MKKLLLVRDGQDRGKCHNCKHSRRVHKKHKTQPTFPCKEPQCSCANYSSVYQNERAVKGKDKILAGDPLSGAATAKNSFIVLNMISKQELIDAIVDGIEHRTKQEKLKAGKVAAPGITLPPGITIPSGTMLKSGIALPAGSTVAAGTDLSDGIKLLLDAQAFAKTAADPPPAPSHTEYYFRWKLKRDEAIRTVELDAAGNLQVTPSSNCIVAGTVATDPASGCWEVVIGHFQATY